MTDDKRLQRIEDKLDDAAHRITSIDVTLAAQHVSLREHIKRSDLLEAQMKPIERKINMVEGALKLIGLIAVLVGIAEILVKARG